MDKWEELKKKLLEWRHANHQYIVLKGGCKTPHEIYAHLCYYHAFGDVLDEMDDIQGRK